MKIFHKWLYFALYGKSEFLEGQLIGLACMSGGVSTPCVRHTKAICTSYLMSPNPTLCEGKYFALRKNFADSSFVSVSDQGGVLEVPPVCAKAIENKFLVRHCLRGFYVI